MNQSTNGINYMCLLVSLYIISTQTIFNNKLFVQSRSIDDSFSIDDEDFCQLQLHRRQYFTDPRPKSVKHDHKHLKIYQVKSVRSIGMYICLNFGQYYFFAHSVKGQ